MQTHKSRVYNRANAETESVRLQKELQIANSKISRSEAKLSAIRRHLELKIEHEKELEQEIEKAERKICSAKVVITSCLRSFRASAETKNWVANILEQLEDTSGETLEKRGTQISLSVHENTVLDAISEEKSEVYTTTVQPKRTTNVTRLNKKSPAATTTTEKIAHSLDNFKTTSVVVQKENSVAGKSFQRRNSARKSLKPLSSIVATPLGDTNCKGNLTQCPHNWYLKVVIRPEICQPCGKRIGFSKNAFKCIECKAASHPDCKDKMYQLISNGHTEAAIRSQVTPKSETKAATESNPHGFTPVSETPKVRGTLHYFATPMKGGKSVLRLGRRSTRSSISTRDSRPVIKVPKFSYFD